MAPNPRSESQHGLAPENGQSEALAKVVADVSLEDACALALRHHPSLQRFSYEQRAADARLLIARRPPNPSVELEVEDFAGSGIYSGTRSAIYTASLVQLLETGGKRLARSAIAAAEAAQVRAEYEMKRREVLATTSVDFVDALAAKEAVALAEREVSLAESGLESVKGQISAGRATDSQRKLAMMAVTEAQLELRQAKRGLERSLGQLASSWGGVKPKTVNGLLAPPTASLPARDRLKAVLEEHPEVANARLHEEQATARLGLARAGRYQDVELGVGTRHDRASGDDALVLGARVPLPLFETGDSGVKAASAEVSAASLAVESVRLDLRRRFELAWADFADGHDAAMTIENELMPTAREVFESIDESYRLGRSSFVEWLEARRQLASASRRWLKSRRDFQAAAATLQGLTGRSL